jgi:NAD(P)-dependent dehydrogenase (short-subunit alcohol dehydrogenase family)
MYPWLDGKPVLIARGGNGIGAAMVELFARQHTRVAFAKWMSYWPAMASTC